MNEKVKQIEEMADDIYTNAPCLFIDDDEAKQLAGWMYKEGYRKQIDGEWKVKRTAKVLHITCSLCNYTKRFDRLGSITDEKNYIINDFIKEHRFCPNCGTKMKGGEPDA